MWSPKTPDDLVNGMTQGSTLLEAERDTALERQGQNFISSPLFTPHLFCLIKLYSESKF